MRSRSGAGRALIRCGSGSLHRGLSSVVKRPRRVAACLRVLRESVSISAGGRRAGDRRRERVRVRARGVLRPLGFRAPIDVARNSWACLRVPALGRAAAASRAMSAPVARGRRASSPQGRGVEVLSSWSRGPVPLVHRSSTVASAWNAGGAAIAVKGAIGASDAGSRRTAHARPGSQLASRGADRAGRLGADLALDEAARRNRSNGAPAVARRPAGLADSFGSERRLAHEAERSRREAPARSAARGREREARESRGAARPAGTRCRSLGDLARSVDRADRLTRAVAARGDPRRKASRSSAAGKPRRANHCTPDREIWSTGPTPAFGHSAATPARRRGRIC